MRPTDPSVAFWPASRARQSGEVALYTALLLAIALWGWGSAASGGALAWVYAVLVGGLLVPPWALRVAGLFGGHGVRLDATGMQLKGVWGSESTPWTNIKWVGLHRDVPGVPPVRQLRGVVVVHCHRPDEVTRSRLAQLRRNYVPVPGPFVIWIRPGMVADPAGLESSMLDRLGLREEDHETVFAEGPFTPDDWFPPEFEAKRRRTGYPVAEVDALVTRLEDKVRRCPSDLRSEDFGVDFEAVTRQRSYDIDLVTMWLEDLELELLGE